MIDGLRVPRGGSARGVRARFVAGALVLFVPAFAAAAPVAVVVDGPPAAPPLTPAGPGLCMSSAISTAPATDFGTSTVATYNATLNAFLEQHEKDRTTGILGTVFDLSNNNTQGLKLSYGDFTDAMPVTCKTGGCDFPWNDTTTSFGSRLRGYLDVTPDLAGKPIHLAFYADDAVSLTLFDANQKAYGVVTRPPVLGAPTWRTTNTVTFQSPGLYPVEVLYVEIVEHAALEMSLLVGPFDDYELPANQMGSSSLRTAGFQLLPPARFYGTENGLPAFPKEPSKCSQCNRQFANHPGNGGCGAGYYCNGAALCAPCDSALYCGSSCAPCGQSSPFCINVNADHVCVQCRDDGDCKTGFNCKNHLCVQCTCPIGFRCDMAGLCIPCDTVDHCGDACGPCGKSEPYCIAKGAGHLCVRCLDDKDCPRGTACADNRCEPCGAGDHCAGASCNCCGGHAKCGPLADNSLPVCIECTSDADCAMYASGTSGRTRCDTVNGRCVDHVEQCNTPAACGPSCARCPKERPHCLDAQVCVECRSDVDCAAGAFCLSGECAPCTVDRRCGMRCASCGGDTPFCLSDGLASHAACVRCRSGADCAVGACDPLTHSCAGSCGGACAAGQRCDGVRCVECYAATHCPCGGSCDVVHGSCAPPCIDSSDCRATEHCTAMSHECKPGRVKPGTKPEGGGPCCGAGGGVISPLRDGEPSVEAARAGGGGDVAQAALVVVLLGGVLLLDLGRRRRARRGGRPGEP